MLFLKCFTTLVFFFSHGKSVRKKEKRSLYVVWCFVRSCSCFCPEGRCFLREVPHGSCSHCFFSTFVLSLYLCGRLYFCLCLCFCSSSRGFPIGLKSVSFRHHVSHHSHRRPPAPRPTFPRGPPLHGTNSKQHPRNTLVQPAVFQPRRNASWPRQSTRDTKNAIVPWCRARPHATSAPLATLNSATQDRDLTYRLSPGALRGRPFPGFHETRPS